MDDHILAQPLNDSSTSNSGFQNSRYGHNSIINSTPLLYKSRLKNRLVCLPNFIN